MQRLEVSGAVRPLYVSLGVKGLTKSVQQYISVAVSTGMLCECRVMTNTTETCFDF